LFPAEDLSDRSMRKTISFMSNRTERENEA
jgi:hypothetical protein